jgi:hypothetical protein
MLSIDYAVVSAAGVESSITLPLSVEASACIAKKAEAAPSSVSADVIEQRLSSTKYASSDTTGTGTVTTSSLPKSIVITSNLVGAVSSLRSVQSGGRIVTLNGDSTMTCSASVYVSGL